MGQNMKLKFQIVLLLLTTASVFVSGGPPVDINADVGLTLYDDYGNPVNMNLDVVNTGINTSESNYPNTVKFYLYRRDSGNNSVQLYVGDTESLQASNFDPKIPTVFVAHGYLNNYLSPACTYIRDAYFQHGDYNVILIDWGDLTRENLVTVGHRAESVAKYVCKMLDFLVSQGMDPSNTTMVGHSYGAHLVGLASYYAKNKMNYIVGMDPAGPTFYFKGKGRKLTKDDGNYVLVIHTSSYLGSLDPVGHADFYPNGGRYQPGCNHSQTFSHMRAYEYFAESINKNGFLAYKCGSYSDYKKGLCKNHKTALMGGVNPNFGAIGTYYLDTHGVPPFSMY